MDSIPTQNNPTFKPAPKSDDTEISIFDAHKYFNDTHDSKPDQSSLSVPRSSSSSSISSNFPTKSQSGAHPASSEASWNSRTGLLTNPPCSIGISHIHFPANCKWISAARRWLSARKCCCNGEKCVRVKEERKRPVVLISNADRISSKNIVEIHNIKAMEFAATDAPRQRRISASGPSFIDGAVGFTFPIFGRDGAACKQSQVPASPPINVVGDSLSSFRPIQEAPSTENPRDDDDDVRSEASSDLFEIESFSTQTTSYPTHLRKDSADDQDQTYIERRFASANEIINIHDRRRSVEKPAVAESECVPSRDATICQEEEAEGGEGKQKSNGTIAMSIRPVAAEAPPMFALHVGGRPLRANKPPLDLGSYHSDRLSLAFTV